MAGPNEFDFAGTYLTRHSDKFRQPFELHERAEFWGNGAQGYPPALHIDLGQPIDVASILDLAGYTIGKKGASDEMMLALTILQLIGGLLPVISQGILTVEQPGVPGAQKAAAVTDLALSTLEAVSPGTVAKVGHNNIFGGIQAAISSLVGHFNKTGALPKVPKPATENATAQGGPAPVKPSISGPAPGA